MAINGRDVSILWSFESLIIKLEIIRDFEIITRKEWIEVPTGISYVNKWGQQ